MQDTLRYLLKALQTDKIWQVILLEQKKKKLQMILKAYRQYKINICKKVDEKACLNNL